MVLLLKPLLPELIAKHPLLQQAFTHGVASVSHSKKRAKHADDGKKKKKQQQQKGEGGEKEVEQSADEEGDKDTKRPQGGLFGVLEALFVHCLPKFSADDVRPLLPDLCSHLVPISKYHVAVSKLIATYLSTLPSSLFRGLDEAVSASASASATAAAAAASDTNKSKRKQKKESGDKKAGESPAAADESAKKTPKKRKGKEGADDAAAADEGDDAAATAGDAMAESVKVAASAIVERLATNLVANPQVIEADLALLRSLHGSGSAYLVVATLGRAAQLLASTNSSAPGVIAARTALAEALLDSLQQLEKTLPPFRNYQHQPNNNNSNSSTLQDDVLPAAVSSSLDLTEQARARHSLWLWAATQLVSAAPLQSAISDYLSLLEFDRLHVRRRDFALLERIYRLLASLQVGVGAKEHNSPTYHLPHEGPLKVCVMFCYSLSSVCLLLEVCKMLCEMCEGVAVVVQCRSDVVYR